MTILTKILFIILVYLCIYGVVERVCKCVEKCFWYKYYSENAQISVLRMEENDEHSCNS